MIDIFLSKRDYFCFGSSCILFGRQHRGRKNKFSSINPPKSQQQFPLSSSNFHQFILIYNPNISSHSPYTIPMDCASKISQSITLSSLPAPSSKHLLHKSICFSHKSTTRISFQKIEACSDNGGAFPSGSQLVSILFFH